MQEDDNGTWDFLSKYPRLSKPIIIIQVAICLCFPYSLPATKNIEKWNETGNSKNLKREQKGFAQDDKTDPRNPFPPDGENIGYKRRCS